MTNLDRVTAILPGNMKIYVRKCSTTCFQMQVSDFDHLNYFLNNAVIVTNKKNILYLEYSRLRIYFYRCGLCHSGAEDGPKKQGKYFVMLLSQAEKAWRKLQEEQMVTVL